MYYMFKWRINNIWCKCFHYYESKLNGIRKYSNCVVNVSIEKDFVLIFFWNFDFIKNALLLKIGKLLMQKSYFSLLLKNHLHWKTTWHIKLFTSKIYLT
jgi:hypothetical protein